MGKVLDFFNIRFTAFDVPITINWTLTVFFLASILVAGLPGMLFMGILFSCVAFHETGHIIAIRALGIRVKMMTLWIFGGGVSIEGGGDKLPPKPDLIVSLAGPAASLFLGGLLYAVSLMLDSSMQPTGVVGNPVGQLLRLVGMFNLAILAGLNMLPIIPLDGGRAVRAYCRMRRPLMGDEIAFGISCITGVLVAIGALFLREWFIAIFAALSVVMNWFAMKNARLEREATVRRLIGMDG